MTQRIGVCMPLAMNILTRAAAIACLMAAGSGGGQAQAVPHQDFVCTSGGSRRVISVFNLNDAGGRRSCRVDYTKDGRTKTLYSSTTSRAYCAAKATLLVTNLARADYSCRAQTLEEGEDAEPPQRPPAAKP